MIVSTDLYIKQIKGVNKSKSRTINILDIDTGIPRENLENIADILNDDLADEYVLLTKTRNYHWNVEKVLLSIKLNACTSTKINGVEC